MTGAAAVRSRKLSKVYGHATERVVALDRVNVQIPAGEFTAVMGPSGSGKSTPMLQTE
jgi:putative ABC transport system ATP-binding protein